jgi:hypothetical protein
MSYPLVLNREELQVLRTMLRTVITTRISSVVEDHRKIVLMTPEPGDAEREDDLFVGRINSWINTRINLDLPLIEASLKLKDDVVILNVGEAVFKQLRNLTTLSWTTSDESQRPLVDQIQVIKPALVAAFEVAEANERAVANPTQPPAASKLN